MPSLVVKNFSCVDDAELDLSKLTILIGPQASGKSVISKLVYFFYDIIAKEYRAIEDQQTLSEFKETLTDEFKKWFPPSAWGSHHFVITFSAGPLFIKVTRLTGAKGGKGNVRINFSPYLEEHYLSVLAEYKSALAKRKKTEESGPPDFELFWRIQSEANRKLERDLGRSFVSWQIFVPAGRSFFTSVGKAIAVFEYGGVLDPLTVQFGKFYAAIRDSRRSRMFFGRRPDRTAQEARNRMMHELFGGNIKFEREQEYVESEDGRRIPFATLSSGQQELLPLWLAVEYMQEGPTKSLIYIEEPEAHLFPTAQSQLVEYLASIVSDPRADQRMLITTHSPYVLSEINILLKAGNVANKLPTSFDKISKIVQSKNWLAPDSTMAYAIVGKRLKKIIDSEGLIDGDYLDEVSGYLSREFNSLLAIEHP